MNFGFIGSTITLKDRVFGKTSLPKKVLQPNASWREYLPEYEPQFGGDWDTFGCTLWAFLNAIETMDRKLFGKKSDYSEKYLANLIPLRPPGVEPQRVPEAIKKYGLIDQSLLPMPLTYEEFTAPTPTSPELVAIGRQWLDEYNFDSELLWSSNIPHEKKIALLKECLKYSPILVSVTAWSEERGVYVDNDLPNNHLCLCFEVMTIAEVDFPKVFDTYDQSIKTLSSNHHIDRAWRIHLSKKTSQHNSFLSKLFSLFFKKYNLV